MSSGNRAPDTGHPSATGSRERHPEANIPSRPSTPSQTLARTKGRIKSKIKKMTMIFRPGDKGKGNRTETATLPDLSAPSTGHIQSLPAIFHGDHGPERAERSSPPVESTADTPVTYGGHREVNLPSTSIRQDLENIRRDMPPSAQELEFECNRHSDVVGPRVVVSAENASPANPRGVAGAAMVDNTLEAPPSHDSAAPVVSQALTSSTVQDAPVAARDGPNSAKEALGVVGRFAQTVIKKIPDVVDGNPVKMAFSIAKAVIETKDAFHKNKENVHQYIVDVSERLRVIDAATDNGKNVPKGTEKSLEDLVFCLRGVVQDLKAISDVSLSIQIFDYEKLASNISTAFEKIRSATENFQISMGVATHQTAEGIGKELKIQALKSLDPARNAQYNAATTGKSLKRVACTEGTRTAIIDAIERWVDSDASNSVFWLTGQAGAGKTTILYTIAEKVDKGLITGTRLGGDFFCSRQFEETRAPHRIIPTTVYDLAGCCKPFGDALHAARLSDTSPDPFTTVSLGVEAQLKALLLIPWQQSQASRAISNVQYLIVIDALDEMDGQGATEFLRALFHVLSSNQLTGLKFLIASRTHPEIMRTVQGFEPKGQLWLQHVRADQASADIRKYLQENLPGLGQGYQARIEAHAQGLFIFAATAVRYITRGLSTDISLEEQKEMADELLSYSRDTGVEEPDFLIDNLYRHVVVQVLAPFTSKQRAHRLKLLHLFLSTYERETPSTIAAIAGDASAEKARVLVEALHAVLYLDGDGRIFWYHASFPDFIFDSTRSNFELDGKPYRVSCSESAQRAQLHNFCFDHLRSLHFNMANLPSSFLLDDDIPADERRVSDGLAYAATNWIYYLPTDGYVDATVQAIESFLQLRILFWVEVLNLIKSTDKALFLLRSARSWLEKYSVTLLAGLEEVIAFTTAYEAQHDYRFSCLRSSTPHLYISHLATWSGGPLIRSWRSHFIHLPILTHSDIDIPVLLTSSQPDQRLSYTTCEISRPRDAEFLNNDARIVSGHDDGALRIWDVSSGTLLHTLQGHHDPVYSVAVAADVNWIFSGSIDRTVRVWDASTGIPLHIVDDCPAWVYSISVSSNGERVVARTKGDVYLWNLGSCGQWQRRVLAAHTGAVSCVAISANGSYVATASLDCTARMWNADTGEVSHVLQFRVTPYGVSSVEILPDSSTLVVVSAYRRVDFFYLLEGRLHNRGLLEGQKLLGFNHQDLCYPTLSPDGQTFAAQDGRYGGTIHLWRRLGASTWRWSRSLTGPSLISAISFSNNSTRIVSAAMGSIRIWDVTGQENSILLKNPSFPTAITNGDASHIGPNIAPQSQIPAIDPRCVEWYLDSLTGWICKTEDKDCRLMWVHWRHDVQDPSCIRVISDKGYGSVDFSDSIDILGENWARCYVP